jgi:hypothetical protein
MHEMIERSREIERERRSSGKREKECVYVDDRLCGC